MRRFLFLLGTITMITAVLFYWFLWDGRIQSNSGYTIDIAAVRMLSNEIEGMKPTDIQVEKVAQFYFPSTLSMAGSGFEILPMGVYSFKAVSSDGHVIIDTGYDKIMASSARADFFPEAYGRMQDALNTANKIVITHEHYDHIGGLTQHPSPADIIQNVVLTTEQVQATAEIRPRFPEGTLNGYQPLRLNDYAAIAPGIVLIKAPGHTPGSVMVYVQLENGVEYLFVGDIAWHQESISNPTLRPRVITSLFLSEESRIDLSAQLTFLNELKQNDPDLIQVAGHDNVQIEALFESGLMTEQFSE